MKKHRIIIASIIALVAFSASWAGPADEFLSLSREITDPPLEQTELWCNPDHLKNLEKDLAEKMMQCPGELKKLASGASEIDEGLMDRLLVRLKNNVGEKQNGELQEAFDVLNNARKAAVPVKKRNENSKILIFGKPIDLASGAWYTAPDGKKFWRSEQNPECILTPAEYKRFLSATETRNN